MSTKLQDKILTDYKRVYPNQTIREMSIVTQINPSRVFRLLNGYEMKLKEYECIEKAILERESEKNSFSDYFSLSKVCFEKLSTRKIERLIEEMNFQLNQEYIVS